MPSQAPRHIKSIVAQNIRAARDSRGLTQRQLGALVNDMDGLAVSRWERGKVHPSLDSLTTLARVFDVDIAWFYTEHEEQAA
jgi:transcriptional regulator with XRE-family HTH domain